MSTNADTRLPAPAVPSSSSAAPDPDGPEQSGRISVRAGRRAQDRTLAWGLGISAALHLLLLIFASRTWIPVRSAAAGGEPVAGPAGAALPEMQAYRLHITEDAVPLTAEEPPEITEADRIPLRRTPTPVEPSTTPVDPQGRGVGATQAEATAPVRTPAERLQPELVDPRLWERAEAPPPPEKTDFEVARERVYARIDALNDSLAAEGEATRRATDWTYTDKDGKKWGVSPGQVHLGGISVPLPFGFSAPPDQAKEARDRAAKAGEIGHQADRARVRGTFDEQAKATRAERDRARAAQRDSTKAGGT